MPGGRASNPGTTIQSSLEREVLFWRVRGARVGPGRLRVSAPEEGFRKRVSAFEVSLVGKPRAQEMPPSWPS